MCLKVDDATATLDRAEKLRDTPFRQAVGPGELEIPAVRGLGGSLLYFVDPKSQLGRLWDIDFTAPKEPQGNGGAGLTAVDHVSQSMHYEEMLSWLLFYNSLLDVTKTPQLDVIDPGGIVRSQVVQTADGSLRIALNASQSQQTLSSRFLTHYFGSGVQHIALATDDIVATMQKLRANGVDMLPIPENYYDDLEARTDIVRGTARGAARPRHPVRPRRSRRVPPGLYPQLRGPVLLRDRRAPGLPGLRRGERIDQARRTDARGEILVRRRFGAEQAAR